MNKKSLIFGILAGGQLEPQPRYYLLQNPAMSFEKILSLNQVKQVLF